MTLRKFEKKLQECNPKLFVKCYGTSKAGIHLGTKFICRVPQGEITPYNVFRTEKYQHFQKMTDLNPGGFGTWRRLLKRGRIETARILYTQRVISYSHIAKLSQ